MLIYSKNMTKKINRLFRKVLILILNGLGVSTLLGCTVVMYGMPENYRSVEGTVRGIDTDNDSIGEANGSYKDREVTFTFSEENHFISKDVDLKPKE